MTILDILPINEYLVQDGDRIGNPRRPEVTIRRMQGLDEDRNKVIRWSLRYDDSAYSKSHRLFICEDMPSSRDQDYFDDMRFNTPDEALKAWNDYEGWEKTGVFEWPI